MMNPSKRMRTKDSKEKEICSRCQRSEVMMKEDVFCKGCLMAMGEYIFNPSRRDHKWKEN